MFHATFYINYKSELIKLLKIKLFDKAKDIMIDTVSHAQF